MHCGCQGLREGEGELAFVKYRVVFFFKYRVFNERVKEVLWGLPWWHSGWESACQCRGHRFEPWPGKIPHAAEQLSPCATTTEPVL